MRSESIVFCEYSTVDIEIVGSDAALIHPQAQALVTDELYNPYRLINSGVLLFGTV